MKLSIVIPCYNSSKTITRCLDSIINQTFSDFEIVIVDDGSKDKTLEIIDDFFKVHQSFAKTIIRQEHLGSHLSRRNGVLSSKGDYIGFVDSDDYIDDNHFELLFKDVDEDVDIICSNFTITTNNKTIVNKVDKDYSNKIIDSNTANYLMLNHLGVYQYPWNKVIKRKLFANLYFYDEKFIGEDFIMISQLINKADKILIKQDNTYHYIIHDESKTKSAYGELYENMYYGFEDYRNKNNDIFKNNINSLNRYYLIHYMAILVAMIKADTENTKLKNQILKFVRENSNDYIRNSNDGLMAKISVMVIKHSYPLFKIITKIVLSFRK